MNVLGNVRQAASFAGWRRKNIALLFGSLVKGTSGQSEDCKKCPLVNALDNGHGVIGKAYFLLVVTKKIERIEILSGYCGHVLVYNYQYRQFDLQ